MEVTPKGKNLLQRSKFFSLQVHTYREWDKKFKMAEVPSLIMIFTLDIRTP